MSEVDDLRRRLATLKARKAYEAARAKRLASGPNPEFDPTADMGHLERLAVGNTSGWNRGIRGAVNLALPDSLTPEWASDKRIAQIQDEDRALGNTAAGFAGQLIGEVASTAPVGGGTMAGTKLLARGAPNLLKRTLTSLPTRAATEGAITSAVFADPEARGEAAGAGALAGGAMGTAGKVLGRTIRGIAQKSPEAHNLEFLAAQHGERPFIPLAQAVGDESGLLSRLTKSLYKEAMPYTPGVSGQYKTQTRELEKTFRRVVLKEADAFGVLQPQHFTNPSAAVTALRKAVNDGYDNSIKKLRYRLPGEPQQRKLIENQLRAQFKNIDSTTVSLITDEMTGLIKRFSDGKPLIAGDNLLNVKNELNRLIATKSGPEKAAALEAVRMIESRIKKDTPAALYDIYDKARNSHAAVSALEKGGKGLRGLTPDKLYTASGKSPDMKQVSETFDKVTSQKIGLPGAPGRFTAAAVTGALGALHLPATLTGLAGLNALATRPAQRFMMGSTKGQQALIRALKGNEERAQMIGALGRAGVTTQLGE